MEKAGVFLPRRMCQALSVNSTFSLDWVAVSGNWLSKSVKLQIWLLPSSRILGFLPLSTAQNSLNTKGKKSLIFHVSLSLGKGFKLLAFFMNCLATTISRCSMLHCTMLEFVTGRGGAGRGGKLDWGP